MLLYYSSEWQRLQYAVETDVNFEHKHGALYSVKIEVYFRKRKNIDRRDFVNILIIGNGFDLEHKLPTSYRDFLEFCSKVKALYSCNINTPTKLFQTQSLDGWEVDDSIKQTFLEAFGTRYANIDAVTDVTYDTGIRTSNKALNELYSYVKFNTWLRYFWNLTSDPGKNWIDFESEISRVIQALDAARFQVTCGGSTQNIEKPQSELIIAILKASKGSLRNALEDEAAIEKFTAFLNTELDRLIRALEIYIADFVGKIAVKNKSSDIENLNPDHILSFNYSDTYERVYGGDKEIKYDYIHGKADVNKTVASCNLVLGIDEYLDDEEKNEEFTFLSFKKFYQRIYKSTGNTYLEWVDEIKDGYEAYLKEESDAYIRVVESIKDGSISHFPFQRSDFTLFPAEFPQHTLHIFGHSLDVTDRDVLRLFICNDNVQTKIFYHRKDEDDKRALGKIIKNLIQIMGQDELIRRTGGAHKTIEFVPQAIQAAEEPHL